MKKLLALLAVVALAGLWAAEIGHWQTDPGFVGTVEDGVSGGTAPFSPSDIAGLQLWLDASVGVYEDAGTDPAEDGDAVVQWNDQSGNGWNVSQATGASQPHYDAAHPSFNNQPVIAWDVNGGSLNFPAGALGLFRNIGSCTLVFVIRTDASTADKILLGASINGGTNARLRPQVDAAEKVSLIGRRLDVDGATTVTGGTVLSTTAVYDLIYQVQWTADSQIQAYTNSVVDIDTTAWTSDGNTQDADSATLVLGNSADDGTSAEFDGDMAEVLVYVPAISAGDRALLEGYLATKYGL